MIAVEWLEGVTNARQTLKANDFQRRVMNFNEIHNYAAARAFHFAKRIKDKRGWRGDQSLESSFILSSHSFLLLENVTKFSLLSKYIYPSRG